MNGWIDGQFIGCPEYEHLKLTLNHQPMISEHTKYQHT
jgi:hypothetical protein